MVLQACQHSNDQGHRTKDGGPRTQHVRYGMEDTGCKNQHGGLKTRSMDWTKDRGQRTMDKGWMIQNSIDTAL